MKHNSRRSTTTDAFINAVILGDKTNLSENAHSDYSRLGINHIVAVSGLHFTIIIKIRIEFIIY